MQDSCSGRGTLGGIFGWGVGKAASKIKKKENSDFVYNHGVAALHCVFIHSRLYTRNTCKGSDVRTGGSLIKCE